MPRETSHLLLDEHPLVVQPTLAVAVGLDAAVVLQQLHYWLQKPEAHERDGETWIYNSYEEWHQQLPFLTAKVIGNIFRSLETNGIVVSANFNNQAYDRTKWYRINHDALAGLSIVPNEIMEDAPAGQSPLAETTQGTTTESKHHENRSRAAMSRTYKKPPEEPQAPLTIYPEWFMLCLAVPGWAVDYNSAEKWRQEKRISLDLAEEKAYALRDWWEGLTPRQKKDRKPYLTWQNWCRRDRAQNGGNYARNGIARSNPPTSNETESRQDRAQRLANERGRPVDGVSPD